MDLTKALELVESSKDYQVLRRLAEPTTSSCEGNKEYTGIVIDLETTGFDSGTDEVIEVGMVKFAYDSMCNVTRIIDTYSALCEPTTPIPELITRITGITNEMVKGKKFNLDQIKAFTEDSPVMIAHNAKFDYSFASKLLAEFKNKVWVCSIKDASWIEEGFESTKLEYLGYKHGFFYDGHRAVEDCMATLEILNHARKTEPGEKMLRKCLNKANVPLVKLWAEFAPYDKKDVLKKRGYFWDDGVVTGVKAWCFEGGASECVEEFEFLNSNIYSLPVKSFYMVVKSRKNRFDAEVEGRHYNVSEIIEMVNTNENQ